jgi:hypothetical protein
MNLTTNLATSRNLSSYLSSVRRRLISAFNNVLLILDPHGEELSGMGMAGWAAKNVRTIEASTAGNYDEKRYGVGLYHGKTNHREGCHHPI